MHPRKLTTSVPRCQTADIIGNCYLTAVKRVQDYNKELLEYTHANTKTAFDFAQRMSGVKSPSEFVELSTELAQQQLMTLTEQTKQLAALAQQVTLATADPLKTSLVPTSTEVHAFDFAQRMSGVKSPSEFVELSTEHAQQQLTTLTEQTKQLAALAQQTTLATAEPLKTSLVPTST